MKLSYFYFGDLTFRGVNSPMVPDYRPAVIIKFSLFLVILFTDMYM